MKKFLFFSSCVIFLTWLYLAANTLGYNQKNLNLWNIEQAEAAPTTGNVNISGTILSFMTLAFGSGSNVSFGNITPETAKCGDQSTQASVTTNAANGYTLALSDGGGEGEPTSATLRPDSTSVDTAAAMANADNSMTNLYASIDNYDAPDDMTFIYSNNTNYSYAYFSPAPSIPAGATNISLKLYARLGGGIGRPVKYQWGVKVGAQKYYMTDSAYDTDNGQSLIDTTYREYNSDTTYDTNPAGGDWTVETANTALMGISLQNFADEEENIYHPVCTELWAVWTYTPSGNGSNSAMVHTDGETYISDMSGSTIELPIKWAADHTTQGVGTSMFSGTQKEVIWGTGTTACDVDGNKWAAVPGDAAIGHTVTGFLLDSDSSFWGWRIEVPNTQKTGMYNGNVLFTGVAVLN